MKKKFITAVLSLAVVAIAGCWAQPHVSAQSAIDLEQDARGGTRTDSRMLYHSGQVMTATSNVYFIWYGNWSDRQSTVNLLTTFSTHYGGSPYAMINTTYPNASGIRPSGGLIYGGSVGDMYSHGASLTDADVEDVINDILVGGGLPIDPRGIYMVLATPDIHFDGLCSERCQLHGHFQVFGTEIKYGIVGNPDRCPASCSLQFPAGTIPPNADRAGDAMASWMAHVLNETITDPLGTAWYDRYGLENSDKCVGTYGETYFTSTGGLANMRLGARDYLIQQNWVNDRRGRCALSYP